MSTRTHYDTPEHCAPAPRDFDDPAPGSTAPQLVAEIAQRLLEWQELEGQGRVLSWLWEMGAIARVSPKAAAIVVAYQTGDTREIARSFEKAGAAQAVPRQAVHAATLRAFRDLRSVNPTLAAAVEQLYHGHRVESGDSSGAHNAKLAREEQREAAGNIFQVSYRT